jgi:endonuclease III
VNQQYKEETGKIAHPTKQAMGKAIRRQPVLPVDTHVHRVSRRLGLIAESAKNVCYLSIAQRVHS